MIYWTKLLVIAIGISQSIEGFIPLYLVNQLQLTTIQVSFLFSILYLFRLLSGFWSTFVDSRIHLYSAFVSILAFFSSFSYILLLSFPLYHALSPGWIWCILITSFILNGIFYQPLSPFINTAIIKILGDYRVLFYGSYIRWNKSMTIITTGVIGLAMKMISIDYLDTALIATYLAGMVLLFILALFFIAVEPAHASQLDINEEQAPLLLKNALHLTNDPYPIYRPYSLFGDQLSHISEEDQSQLERVVTTDDSLRLVESRESYTSSFYSRLSSGMLQDQTVVPTLPSDTLALSPSPTPSDALIAFYSQYIKPNEEQILDDMNYTPQYMPKLNIWKSRSLATSIFLLGIGHALLNTFLFIYLYTILEISISMIAWLIMTQAISQFFISITNEKTQTKNLTTMTTCVHIILILCVITYPCLKPNTLLTHIILILLQALQGACFELMWLYGINQVNSIYWSQSDRMQQRSKLAAFYHSFGSTVGVLLAGFILYSNIEDYTLIYKSCVALFSFNFVVSWGWTTDE